MKKGRKDHQFIKKPYYKGGSTALKAFIKKHLVYPTKAQKEKIEGTVYVRYTINYKGKVKEAKIVSGIGHGCDEEAMRLVKLLQFKVPKNRNLKAVFQRDLQIHFRLSKTTTPSSTKQPTQPAIQYTYAPSTNTNTPKPQKESGEGYNFTIQF